MNNKIIISNHNPQDITISQNENQLIFINGGGEVIGITDVLVNNESVVSNNIAYVIVPTKTSELQNNSGFITNETDPTVPSIVKSITQADIINWNSKQDNLVSGNNIKTINNISLLGSGNLNVGGVNYVAGYGIEITEDIINNTITSYNDLTDLPTIPTKTSELINDDNFINGSTLSEVAYSGDYNDLINLPEIPQNTSELVNDSDFAQTNIDNNWNYEQTINGYDLILGTEDSTTDDSSDIRWIYGNKNEKGRLWIPNTPSNNEYRLHYRVKDTSENNIVNTSLAILEDIDILKIAKCTKSITVPAGQSSQSLFAPPTIDGYTFIGLMNYGNGYGDNWLISYSIYGGNIIATILSKLTGSATASIIINLLYLKNDYVTRNVINYIF